jgi:hypothetical protein
MKKIPITTLVLLAMSLAGLGGQDRKTLKVAVQTAVVRAKAEATGAVIKQVKREDFLESAAKVGDWYEVGLYDTGHLVIGYIGAAVVEVVRDMTNHMTALENYKTAEKESQGIATALADYFTDGKKFPIQGEDSKDNWLMKDTLIYKLLVPRYLKKDPSWLDPWGFSYMIFFGNSDDAKLMMQRLGIQEPASDDFLVASYGVYSHPEDWKYNPEFPEAGLYSEFDARKNIIIFNGKLIRGLKK